MQIIINGEEKEINSDISIDKLIEVLNIDSKKIAIECNLEIIPRSEYSTTIISDGDKLEIVHFIGGG